MEQHREAVVRTVRAEEDRFDAVLTAGLPKLEDLLAETTASGSTVVAGAAAFRLYDSLGVPLDFVEDLADQRGLSIDHEGFDQAMAEQRTRARAGSAFDTKVADGFVYADDAARDRVEGLADQFEGYDADQAEATVTALFDVDRREVASLAAGADGFAVLDRTPFYLEAGGQVSDTGRLDQDEQEVAAVTGVVRVAPGGPRAHRLVARRPLESGNRVVAKIDTARRSATRRHHTATHLLHAALRARLGDHVRQAGSLVAPDRLRFDFSHFSPLTNEERQDVERAVNAEIYRNVAVGTDVRDTEDAIKGGAMALFGEKYGETVRVVSVPGYSTELCGGTHVRATGDIGPFVITEESGVAAGVRRIEAVTGDEAVTYLQARAATLAEALAALNVPAAQAPAAIAKLQTETKRLARENVQLKTKLALGGGADAHGDDAVAIGDATFVARRVSGLEKSALRSLSDSLKDRLERGVVVLAAEHEGKVQLLVSVTKNLTSRVKAGQLVKELAPTVGGRGGGRPDFAEAGGRDTSRIDDVLAQARELVTAALGRDGSAG